MAHSNEQEEPRKGKKQKRKKKIATLTKSGIMDTYFYAPLPHRILRSPKLTAMAKLLWAEYMSWAFIRDGMCRPPQKVLAWHLGVTVRCIQKLQKELEDAGAIVVVRRRDENGNLPNKILFAKSLAKLCSRERLSNKAKVYGPAIEAEEARAGKQNDPEPKE